MANIKNVFVQVDTDGLINAIERYTPHGEPLQAPPPEQIRELLTISSQGSLSLGAPVALFQIPVEDADEVIFTILPKVLYSHHKLYFWNISGIQDPSAPPILYQELKSQSIQVSFRIKILNVPAGGYTPFNLTAQIEYTDRLGKLQIVEFSIDPVLRANQGTPRMPEFQEA